MQQRVEVHFFDFFDVIVGAAGVGRDSSSPHNRGGGSMRWSYIPRWKFTVSCGRPRVPGALHLGCAHDAHEPCHHATRRPAFDFGFRRSGFGPFRAGASGFTRRPAVQGDLQLSFPPHGPCEIAVLLAIPPFRPSAGCPAYYALC